MPTPYYQDEWSTIYHADCRDILPDLGSIDCVVTDPPYASGARRDADRQVRGAMLREFADEDWFSHDAMTTWGFSWFLRGVMSALKPLLREGAHLYVFTDWRQQPNVYGLLEAAGYRVNHSLVWDKEHFGMGVYWRNQHEHIVFASHGVPMPMLDRGMGSVIRCRGVLPASRVHPTEKPLPLLCRILRAIPDGIVFDPFMGSGTTLRAAKDVGRKSIGIEIEERYCEIAVKRLRQETLPLHFQEMQNGNGSCQDSMFSKKAYPIGQPTLGMVTSAEQECLRTTAEQRLSAALGQPVQVVVVPNTQSAPSGAEE